jgi:hypothetical protein
MMRCSFGISTSKDIFDNFDISTKMITCNFDISTSNDDL